MEQTATLMANQYLPLLVEWGVNLITAVIILVIGFWLARRAQALVGRVLGRSGRIEPTLTVFLGSTARYLLIAFTLLAVLGRFGVETTSVIALLGAFGIAIGLALQGTLSDVAAGVMLLFFRPFKLGDYVEIGGIGGTVKTMTLFTAELATPDNRKISVPNAKIWGNPIVNFSANPTRRVDLVFGIDYGDDIDQALKVLHACVEADPRCLRDPAPQIVVGALSANSVDLILRVWVATSEYWDVYFDLLKRVKQRFDAAGITIPFPQRVVHQKRSGA